MALKVGWERLSAQVVVVALEKTSSALAALGQESASLAMRLQDSHGCMALVEKFKAIFAVITAGIRQSSTLSDS